MESVLLSTLSRLSGVQKAALKRGSILSIADLMLTSPNDIAKKCKVSPLEVKGMVEAVCNGTSMEVRLLEDVRHEGDETFTTGDARLDDALGGGMRTGMIWEVVGESAAGKTQLALQLALSVQLPENLGGLSGSACYLMTSSQLPTSRLVQISEDHPLLSPVMCSLARIHTISTPTIPILLHVLSRTFPTFLTTQRSVNPVKLLVIDALAELFHSSIKTTTHTLVERSRNISEVSTLLHVIASRNQVAVLVLNEVVDVFNQGLNADVGEGGDLIYRDQARWFNRAYSLPGEDRKEACLGLVWANQVNTRILLSRTGRRRHLEEAPSRGAKQSKTGDHHYPSRDTPIISAAEDQATLIRRMTIIFTSVGVPRSLDYIVTTGGLFFLPENISPEAQRQIFPARLTETTNVADLVPNPRETAQVSPLDLGCSQDGRENEEPSVDGLPEEEWETYWRDNDIPDEVYNRVDLDPLSNNYYESHSQLKK